MQIEKRTPEYWDERLRESRASMLHVIADWALRELPEKRTLRGILSHIIEEVDEAREARDISQNAMGEELADIVILTCDAATKCGIDLPLYIRRKMQKNFRRTWHAPDDSGIVRHVETENR